MVIFYNIFCIISRGLAKKYLNFQTLQYTSIKIYDKIYLKIMYIWLIKFFTFIGTLLSGLVFNFHKPIKGIKTKRNIRYKKTKVNAHERLDIHYHKDYKEGDKLKPIIVYFHGGGWAGYSKGIYSTLSRRLAKKGYVVFNVNYSLAPVYKMDKIISDCLKAVLFAKDVAKNYGGDGSKIILAGDSAGAHISAMITSMINSDEHELYELKGCIKGLLLFYGVYDINTMLTSKFPNIRTYAKACLKGKSKDIEENNKYSPIRYVDSSFPPCFMASGEIDKLHQSQSMAMAEKLKQNGVYVDTLFFEKRELRAMHAYMIFDGLGTNVETLERVDKFLQEIF